MSKLISEDSAYSELNAKVEQRAASLGLDPDASEGIARIDFNLFQQGEPIDPEIFEEIRVACQLWNVDLPVSNFKSHRPIIGPVIVAFKKAFAPMIRFMLKDFIREQRDFNAATVALIAKSLNAKKDS